MDEANFHSRKNRNFLTWRQNAPFFPLFPPIQRGGTTSVCNGCEVVARRRSEGTHPINKTTRVTIEFNRRERTGSRRRSWTAAARQPGAGGEGRRGRWTTTRSKSPSTYPPLLFIVPNFHSLRTRRWLAIQKREEPRRGHTDVGIRFVAKGWTTPIFLSNPRIGRACRIFFLFFLISYF